MNLKSQSIFDWLFLLILCKITLAQSSKVVYMVYGLWFKSAYKRENVLTKVLTKLINIKQTLRIKDFMDSVR